MPFTPIVCGLLLAFALTVTVALTAPGTVGRDAKAACDSQYDGELKFPMGCLMPGVKAKAHPALSSKAGGWVVWRSRTLTQSTVARQGLLAFH